MKLSVIVPAFNEEKLLGATLACIREATAEQCELIVCDNNSTDRTPEIARAAGALVVFEPRNQIARARNAGAAAASGDWLLFIDADSLPSRGLLLEVRDAIAGGACVAGGATVTLETQDRLARLATWTWNRASRLLGWAAGSFIFCRADAFRAIGGFDESLYAGEEIDFSRRIRRLGRLVILHRHPLLTSGRKAELYTWSEMGAFVLRTILSGGRNLRKKESCYAWYDGRR